MGKSADLGATNGSTATIEEHASHLAVGTMQIFLASAVCLPTGLLTAAFLTRQLGPVDYGLLTVTATIIVWIEGTLTVGFSRSAITCIAKAKDWKAVSAKFLQVQLLLGLGATAVLVAVAPLLSSHQMTYYLRIYALSIPITAAGSIHQSILIGHGRFGHRAIIIVAYWLIRMVLIFLFVSYRASVTYAILANVGTSFIVLVWARTLVRPPLFLRSDFPFRKLWNYAWPLFLFTVGINLFNAFDILFVKALSPIPQVTGFFGAAKNLTIIPALFGSAFSPLLLAKLTHLKARSRTSDAKVLSRHAMRLVLCLLPFAAIAAGASSELVTAIYGAPFLPAAPFLAFLIFAALAVAMISVMASTLIAAGRPHLPVLLIGPVVGIAPLIHYVAVCRFGPLGAAATTTGLSCIGAVLTVLAVYRIWQVLPSFATVARTLVVSGIAFVLARVWPAPGLQLLIKLPAIGLFIVLAFFFLGEIRQRDIIFARSLFPGRSSD